MIGYYTHSHGSGHCNYAEIFAKLLGDGLTIFTDRDHAFSMAARIVPLPNENPDGTQFDRSEYREPSSLHYAPINMRKITERNRMILSTVLKFKINLLIVDVSVEVAMLARVSSIPYAYVRLPGDRNDVPHQCAFEGATFLLAYFPFEIESETTPDWVRKKTIYLGCISKYMLDSISVGRPVQYSLNGKPNLLYLSGFGGSLQMDFSSIDKHYNIYIVGPGKVRDMCSVNGYIGIVKCTRAFIEFADIIIAGCGMNTTSEILSLGKRFIAIAEDGHYDEQKFIVRGLEKLDFAKELNNFDNLDNLVDGFLQSPRSIRPKISADLLKKFVYILSRDDFRADTIFSQMHVRDKESSQKALLYDDNHF